MKSVNSPDSLAALVSIPSSKEEKTRKKGNKGYSKEFQAMLDSLEEEDYAEEGKHPSEKKRRLTLDQVRALEKNFEVENKLEPERKLKLAEDLGLQPRQVAVWFQNRRARWKTKQMEKDYGSLKADYESMKVDYHTLQKEHEALTQKMKELKAKVGEENIAESSQSIKEDLNASESENNYASTHRQTLDFSDKNYSEKVNGHILSPPHGLVNWIQFSDSRTILGNGCQVYQPHVFKVEDLELFSAEESCNFFSVDQAPTLQYWYIPDQ